MNKHNAANERIKRDYVRYLAEAKGRDGATVDAVLKSLARFEQSTRLRNFKAFHRNRAVIAFAVVTGARAAALASFRLGDVNVDESCVDQDARHVRTKFSKTFRTFLMPVSDLSMSIAQEWHAELSAHPSRGPQDPLFPATMIGLSGEGSFTSHGLARDGWSTTGPIREIFQVAFTGAGLPYFNPHSVRDMLVRHIMALDLPLETLKSWSQNLGHQGLLTTITSYGSVPTQRQGELIKKGLPKQGESAGALHDAKLIAEAVVQILQTEHRT